MESERGKDVFLFGGEDLGRYLLVQSETKHVMPSRRLNQQAKNDGEYIAAYGLEPYDLKVKVSVLDRDLEKVTETVHNLAKMLYKEPNQKLILPSDRGRYRLATYKGGDELSRLMLYPSTTLTFRISDPVFYGRKRTTTVGTSQTTLKRGGTYKSYPTVTVKPSSSSYWTLYNVTTGEFVRVEASFTGSQMVILDFENQRCTVNGTDHAVTLESDFFALGGTQTLTCSSGTATITWQERWL